MAEQAVDAGYIARYERLRNALRGIELSEREDEILRRIAAARDSNTAALDGDDLWTLAELIERARLAGPGASSRTTIIDLPKRQGRHRKDIPAVGPIYPRKESES